MERARRDPTDGGNGERRGPSVTVSLTSFTLPSPSFRRRRRRDDCKEDRAEGSKERLETGGGTK